MEPAVVAAPSDPSELAADELLAGTDAAVESETPVLDAYMAAQRHALGEDFVPEPEPVSEAEPEPVPAPESAAAPEAPSVPEGLDLEALRRSPAYERQFQSVIDKAAAAQNRTSREEWQAKQRAEIAEQERTKAEAAFAHDLELAEMDDDYDADVQAARKRVTKVLATQRQRAGFEAEAAESIRPQIVEETIAGVRSHLADQYTRGYAAVPEFAGVDAVLHTNYNDAGEWIAAMADQVRAQGRAESAAGEAARIEARAMEIAALRTAEDTAGLRARLPDPDLAVAATGSGAGIGRFRYQVEAERAYNDGKATAAEVHLARARLPYSADFP